MNLDDYCPPPGVYENVPFKQYLGWNAMDKTALWEMRKSPAHFHWCQEHPKAPTAAMEKGTLLDTALFDGWAKIAEIVAVRPEGNGNLKIVKEFMAEAEMTGKIVVTQADLETLKWRVRNIWDHREAAEILSRCAFQVSFVWDDPDTGVRCKGRADLALKGGPEADDLKHAHNAEPGSFRRDVAKYGYQVQAAMYLDGLSCATGHTYDTFRFVLGEDVPPYCANVLPLGSASIAAGRASYSRWLYEYKRCVETGLWPGYDYHQEPIDMPLWALMEEGIDPRVGQYEA